MVVVGPNMTIREHIKRRLMLGFCAAGASWLLVAALMFTREEAPPVPVLFVGMGIFMAAIIFLNFAIRCVRCGGNLGLTIAPALISFFRGKRRISFCPYCGISLDTSLQEAQAVAADRPKAGSG